MRTKCHCSWRSQLTEVPSAFTPYSTESESRNGARTQFYHAAHEQTDDDSAADTVRELEAYQDAQKAQNRLTANGIELISRPLARTKFKSTDGSEKNSGLTISMGGSGEDNDRNYAWKKYEEGTAAAFRRSHRNESANLSVGRAKDGDKNWKSRSQGSSSHPSSYRTDTSKTGLCSHETDVTSQSEVVAQDQNVQQQADTKVENLKKRDEESDRLDGFSFVSDDAEIESHDPRRSSAWEITSAQLIGESFASSQDLAPAYEAIIARVGRASFVVNLRRLLRQYYRRLRLEAVNKVEKQAVKILRRECNRITIAQQILEMVSPIEDRADQQEHAPKHRNEIEKWLAALVPNSKPDVQADAFDVESDASEDSDDDGNEDERENSEQSQFPNIRQVETFLQHGQAYQDLIFSVRLWLVPAALREVFKVVPKRDIRVVTADEPSVLNTWKAFMEDRTGFEWNWRPLQPRRNRMKPGTARVEWKVRT